jgi:hypothetical protein
MEICLKKRRKKMKWNNLKDKEPDENQKVLSIMGNSIGYATWKDKKFQNGEFVAFEEPYYYKDMDHYWAELPSKT